MEIIRKKIEVNKEVYFELHLSIINNFLPKKLSKKEIQVLAAFLSLEGDLAEDPFSTTGRKIVRNKLNMSSGGLGNHLDALIKKDFITEDYKIPNILKPEKTQQDYQFRIVWK
jgi:DNA-binding MarR family transcriptional regulator